MLRCRGERWILSWVRRTRKASSRKIYHLQHLQGRLLRWPSSETQNPERPPTTIGDAVKWSLVESARPSSSSMGANTPEDTDTVTCGLSGPSPRKLLAGFSFRPSSCDDRPAARDRLARKHAMRYRRRYRTWAKELLTRLLICL